MKEIITAGLLFVAAPVEVLTTDKPTYSPSEHIQCLAMNMYHEARDQGTAGKLAVSAVVLNRVNDSRFPNTICEVVKQGPTRKSWRDPAVSYPIRNKCQFSWYCDGLSDKPKNLKQYNDFFSFALMIIQGKVRLLDITDGALWYHADYVRPDWSYHKKVTTEIGDHIFYTIKDEETE